MLGPKVITFELRQPAPGKPGVLAAIEAPARIAACPWIPAYLIAHPDKPPYLLHLDGRIEEIKIHADGTRDLTSEKLPPLASLRDAREPAAQIMPESQLDIIELTDQPPQIEPPARAPTLATQSPAALPAAAPSPETRIERIPLDGHSWFDVAVVVEPFEVVYITKTEIVYSMSEQVIPAKSYTFTKALRTVKDAVMEKLGLKR